MNSGGWYALQVMAGRELRVAAKLERYLKIETLVPMRTLFERRRGKWDYVIKTLMPGYVFARGVTTPESYYEVMRVPDVLSFAGRTAGMPKAIPECEMETVMMLAASAGTPGAKVIKVDKHRRRMTIEIMLLGEAHRLEMGLDTSNPE